jgi:hypothetical protein
MSFSFCIDQRLYPGHLAFSSLLLFQMCGILQQVLEKSHELGSCFQEPCLPRQLDGPTDSES